MKIYQEIIEVNLLCKEKFKGEYSGFSIDESSPNIDCCNVTFHFSNNSHNILLSDWNKKTAIDELYQQYDYTVNPRDSGSNGFPKGYGINFEALDEYNSISENHSTLKPVEFDPSVFAYSSDFQSFLFNKQIPGGKL